MKKLTLLCLLSIVSATVFAQQNAQKLTDRYTDLTIGFGSKQTTIATSYFKDWTIGKKQRLFIGTGLRFNAVMSNGQSFLSAPPKLANTVANTDTLTGSKTQLYTFNLALNLGYHLSSKIDIGFNIDLLGFSFGPSKSALFVQNGNAVNTTAKPTGFNVLLVGTNDRGTLNSEFYIKYKASQKVHLKLALQHYFTELTTSTKVQTAPMMNDRFRNISDLVAFGVSYHF